MHAEPQPPPIKLPRGWRGCVKSAVLYAIALAHYSIVTARAWAADIRGILGSVVALRVTPVLAVLLVGGRGYRPPLMTRDGH
jgi:hypothetical protein